MRLPTVKVRFIASGHVATINVSDFNPAVHAELNAPPAPPDVVQPAPTPVEDNLVFKALLAQIRTSQPEMLDILESDERAGENRKKVFKAIDRRRESLKEVADDPGS